jgi:WD40 repeat protein
MRIGKRLSALVVFLFAALGGENKPDKPVPPAGAESVEQWIAQLDADSLAKREEAIRRLIALGPSALAALQRTADDLRIDPDVRLRAARAAYAIQTVKIEQVRRLGEHQLSNFRWATRIALSPDGKYAVTAGMDDLRYWDLAKQKLIRNFGANKNGYWSVSFSSDGRRVAAGARNHKVYLFDVNTGALLCEMTGHNQEVWGALLTADGKQVISGSWDASIRVWDAATGKEIRAFKNVRDRVRCLTLSPDGKVVAASHFANDGSPGIIRLWDVEKGTEIRALKGHELEVTSLAFSADGKHLLSSSFDKTIRLWSVADAKEVKRFKGHADRIECAAFTPDGKRVVSCGEEHDPFVRLWDAASGKQLGASERVNEGFLCIAALADGQHCLTTGKDGAVRLWRWSR